MPRLAVHEPSAAVLTLEQQKVLTQQFLAMDPVRLYTDIERL